MVMHCPEVKACRFAAELLVSLPSTLLPLAFLPTLTFRLLNIIKLTLLIRNHLQTFAARIERACCLRCFSAIRELGCVGRGTGFVAGQVTVLAGLVVAGRSPGGARRTGVQFVVGAVDD